MSKAPEWLSNGTGLVPRIAWSFAADAELVSLTMSRECGDIFAIDRAGGLYKVSRTGRIDGVNRGLRVPRIVRWSDTGETGLVIEGREHITIVDAKMRVVWTAAAPSNVVAADIDAYGHNIVVSLESNDTVFMNVDRQKLAQFNTIRPLKFLSFNVSEPSVIGAAEHGLICCHDLDGVELWNERLWTNVGDVSVSGDAKRIFIAEFGHGLHSLDGRGRNQSAFVLEGSPSRVSTSFFGERVATSTMEKQLFWIDADGTLLWAAESPEPIHTLICDPLGEWLIVGFESGRVMRLDWEG